MVSNPLRQLGAQVFVLCALLQKFDFALIALFGESSHFGARGVTLCALLQERGFALVALLGEASHVGAQGVALCALLQERGFALVALLGKASHVGAQGIALSSVLSQVVVQSVALRLGLCQFCPQCRGFLLPLCNVAFKLCSFESLLLSGELQRKIGPQSTIGVTDLSGGIFFLRRGKKVQNHFGEIASHAKDSQTVPM